MAKKKYTLCERIVRSAPAYLVELYDKQANTWNASLFITAYVEAIRWLDLQIKTKAKDLSKRVIPYTHVTGLALQLDRLRTQYMIYGLARSGMEPELQEHDAVEIESAGEAYVFMWQQCYTLIDKAVSLYNEKLSVMQANTATLTTDGEITSMTCYTKRGRGRKTHTQELMTGTIKPFSFQPLDKISVYKSHVK